MDERVHLTLDARKHDAAVCGADHRDIIRTSYRPDVTCPYCLLADLEADGSPGRGQGVEHARGAVALDTDTIPKRQEGR